MDIPPFARDELEAALRGAQVGLWAWHFEPEVLRWSRETYAIYRVDPATFECTVASYLALIHQDDRARAETTVRQALTSKAQDYYLEHRVADTGDEVVWVEARGRVLQDDAGRVIGMTGTAVDASARLNAEAELRDREQRYRLFSELATDYVYEATVDESKTSSALKIVAGSFERVVGHSLAVLEERGGWLKIIHPDDLPQTIANLNDLMEGRPVVQEYRILDGDGQVRWLRDRILPVRNSETGLLTTFLGGVTEITEQKRLVEELVRARKMEALARLAGGVAHDFNNLLTILYAEFELIQRLTKRAIPEERSASVHAVLQRANELTRTLLTFGRQQATQLRVERLNSVVEDARSMLTRAAGERVAVHLELMDEGDPKAQPLHVTIDAGELQLVMINLVLNARHAMSTGGRVVVRSGVRRLSRESGERPPELDAGSYAFLEVEDEGEGIPAQHLGHLFEPYFTTKDAGQGTGLGLAMAHGIVQRASGAIHVDSVVGRGTRVSIYLPLTDAPVETVRPAAVIATVGGHEHVLLVEDDESVRNVIERSLAGLGYVVRAVGSAEDALAAPEEELSRVQLLVSDVRLPGMDGIELADRLTATYPGLRVLLVSGYLGEHEARFERSAYALLPKPFTTEGLARRCVQLLAESRPEPEPHSEP